MGRSGRSAYGGGSMKERSPGVWRLRAMTERGQVERIFRGTETAARRELAKLSTNAQAGQVSTSARRIVGDLLDAWLEHITPTRSPKTIHEYRAKIDKRIRPALGAKRLDRLGADTLDAWYRIWLDEGLSPSTVHHHHGILSAALNQAVKWGWIPHNPAVRASPPPLRAKPMTIPTPEQLNAVYRAAHDRDAVLATAIALAALTGARRGELAALRWSDVDLVAGRISISRSLSVVGGATHEGPTKTHARRVVALDQDGVRVLRDRWQSMRDLSEQAESPLVDDPFVLSYNANGGRPVGPDFITHRFAAVNRQLGMSFRFHDLRHFSVSTLIAAGVDIRTVAERHGHAQATMTLNRYAHALPERDREAAAVLGAALGLGRPALPGG